MNKRISVAILVAIVMGAAALASAVTPSGQGHQKSRQDIYTATIQASTTAATVAASNTVNVTGLTSHSFTVDISAAATVTIQNSAVSDGNTPVYREVVVVTSTDTYAAKFAGAEFVRVTIAGNTGTVTVKYTGVLE